jgi:transcriptional regulator with XRE-family HTH domain
MEALKGSLKDRLYEAMAIRGKKAVDITRDLRIPKSAVSQYLSGKSQKMDSERLYLIAEYLDVAEPWLLGYDVPMERIDQEEMQKNNDTLADIAVRLRTDKAFFNAVSSLYKMDADKLESLSAFLK